MGILDTLGEFGLDPRELARRLQPNIIGTPPFIPQPSRPGAPAAPGNTPVGPMSQPGPMGRTAAPADAGSPQLGKVAPPPPTQAAPPPTEAEQRMAALKRPELHGWRNVLDIIGQIAAPRIEERIPGTPGHYSQEMGKLAGLAKEEQGIRERRATMGKTLADTADLDSQRRLRDDQAELDRKKINEPPKPELDKKIDEYTGADGKRVEVMQRADNSTYERTGGVVRDENSVKPGTLKPDILAQVGERPATPQYKGKTYPTVEAAQAAWGDAYDKIERANAAAAADVRGESYGRNRPVEVLDTWNSNRPIRVSAGEQEDNPERYVNASGGAQALMKGVTLDDIKRALNNVKKTTAVLDNGTLNRAVIAAALADPKTTAGNFGQSEFIKQLNPAERNYVISVLTAREVAPGIRGLLGAGAATDARVKLLLDTLPGAQTPDSKYANQQIDSQLQTLERVRPGIPSVTPQSTAGGAPPTGGPKPFTEWQQGK